MATLIFAQAKAIRKKAKAEADIIEKGLRAAPKEKAICRCEHGPDSWMCMCGDEEIKKLKAEVYDKVVEAETMEFKAIMEIARDLTGVYREVSGQDTRHWMFITIRPDMTKILFEEFRSKMVKKINSCVRILEATYSFEQKGESVETLGHGFHIHIMAWVTWAYPSGARRDLRDFAAAWCGPKSVDVRNERDPAGCIQRYLIDYKSEDGHKEKTKKWDSIWRAEKGLKGLYYKNGNTALLSDQGGGTATNKE